MIEFNSSQRYRRRAEVRYLIAALSVAAALILTWGLKQLFPTTPNALYFCAIILSAWFGGFGPGIFASVLTSAAVHFTPPASTTGLPRHILFLLVGIFISWLIERQNRAQAALQQARDLLDTKVRERTATLEQTNKLLEAQIVERKQTEERIASRDQQFRLLVETAPVAIVYCNPDGLIECFNPKAVELWGRAPAVLDARDRFCGSLRLYHMDGASMPHPENPMAKVLRTGIPEMNREVIVERPDGTRIIVLASVAPLKTELGNVTGAVSSMLDITDRKRTEALLHAREQEFRMIVENTPDVIVRYDRELRRTFVNAAAAALFGLSKDVLLRGPAGSATKDTELNASPQQIEMLRTSIQAAIETGQPREFEITWPAQEGEKIFNIRLAPEFDPHGAVGSVLGVGRDITERKRMENALRQSENQLRLVIDTIPTMAWIVLPDGALGFINHRWLEYTGLSLEEALKDPTGTMHPDDLQRAMEKWSASMASEEPYEAEMRLRRADGEYRWFLVRTVPLFDDRGNLLQWYGTSTDIEDLKRAEQALLRAQGELGRVARLTIMGELTASIAHEVNQPLAAVVTNANASLRWLAAAPPNLDEAREAIRRIIRDGNRAGEVIARIRTLLNKGESVRMVLNISEVIQETLTFAQSELARHKVSLHTELATGLPEVRADRVQLQQVLLNLLVNALDSLSAVADRPRVLRIRTDRHEQDTVRVAVQDTGIGVDGEQSKRLFQAFFTTKPNGLGMGLAISRSIIEAHGGCLWMTPNDGPGVTFQFTLPGQSGGAT